MTQSIHAIFANEIVVRQIDVQDVSGHPVDFSGLTRKCLNPPLVRTEDVIQPPLHLKLGYEKQCFKKLKVDFQVFRYLKEVACPNLSGSTQSRYPEFSFLYSNSLFLTFISAKELFLLISEILVGLQI